MKAKIIDKHENYIERITSCLNHETKKTEQENKIKKYTKDFLNFVLNYNISSEVLVDMLKKVIHHDIQFIINELLLKLSFTNKYDSDTRRRINIYIENESPYSSLTNFEKFVAICANSDKVNDYTFKIPDSDKAFDFIKSLPNLKTLNIDNEIYYNIKKIDLTPYCIL